jgi:mannose-6-phosphate isomerase-like protein (cupin superfamily)
MASKTRTPRKPRKPVLLEPGAGRAYDLGPVRAVFKADGDETKGRYSISEWWLEPHTKGPGGHSHEEDDVFFVLEGTMTFRVGTKWIEAEKGAFVLAPGGVTHDFENRTSKRAGMLNVSTPGDFEPHMPGIAEWFRARSPEDARTQAAPKRATPKRAARPPRRSGQLR